MFSADAAGDTFLLLVPGPAAYPGDLTLERL